MFKYAALFSLVSTFASAEGMVSFTVDNVTHNFIDNALPLFEQYDVQGTIYIETQPIGTDPYLFSWDDVRELQGLGWDIGAHSYTHPHMTQLSDEALFMETVRPGLDIEEETGVYPSSFATPFGDYDDRVLEMIDHHYHSHLNAWIDDGWNDLPIADLNNINRFEIWYDRTVESVCTDIERAGRENKWIVYFIHGVTEGEGEDWQISQDLLDGILSCAVDLENRGIVSIVTVDQALIEQGH